MAVTAAESTWNFWWLYAVSLLIHAVLISPEIFVRGTGWAGLLQFTDIDYAVFVGGQQNAQKLPVNRSVGRIPAFSSFLTDNTPYARTTYRYSPVMGALTGVNDLFGAFSSAKYLFVAFNMLTFFMTERILKHYRVNKNAALVLMCMTALNPIIIQVASRGNSDSVMTAIVSTSLYFHLKGRWFISAILLGLGIHAKMYPVILLAPMILVMSEKSEPVTAISNLLQPILPALKDIRDLRAAGASFRGLRKSFGLAVYLVCLPMVFVLDFLTNRVTVAQWLYGLTAVGVAVGLTYGVYALYGWVALYESVLYHLVRHDHRHNMSIHSIWATMVTPQRYYGTKAPWYIGMPMLKCVILLGNKLLVLLVSILLPHKSIGLALFCTTALFVAFNGVVTVQYFVWYMSLLPIAIASVPKWRATMTRGSVQDVLGALKPLLCIWLPLWITAIVLWVLFSDLFEHRGQIQAFYAMGLPDALLLIAHAGMVGTLMA